MNNTCQLSHNTRAYIEQYQCILQHMIEQMSSVTFTKSISGNFIMQMIPHHCAAIAMSENLLRFTISIPLQTIAEHIISSQQKSIENMTQAYARCQLYQNSPQELMCFKRRNDCILNHMFSEMSGACTDNEIDGDFMREMIPHHKGAIAMSEHALRYSICPELRPLLNAIVVSQKRGVADMERLLRQAEC